MNELNLDKCPRTKFLYMAMTKCALTIKSMDKNKEDFMDFAAEIWDSMILSDENYLNEFLNQSMKEDVQSYRNKNGYKK